MAVSIFDNYPKNVLNFNSKSSFKINCDYNPIIDNDTPIYRYIEIKHFLKLLKSQKNVLVKPEEWDDKYENILLQQILYTRNGSKIYLHELRKNYYAQCWTLNIEESDALWRIYSPKNSRVRVKTTIGKLFKSFYDETCKETDDQSCIGKVIYDSKENIIKFFEKNIDNIFRRPNEMTNIIKTLLIKRNEFVHEKEVRIIYRGNEQRNDLTKTCYEYCVDPNYLIEEVLFDPRFKSSNFLKHEKGIKKLGFKGELRMSDLYEVPKLNLVMDRP